MKFKRTLPVVFASATLLSGCAGEKAPDPVPRAISCEKVDPVKLSENSLRALATVIRHCYDTVPETHRSFENPAHPKDLGDNMMTVRLPAKDGELLLVAWSDATERAPVNEFAEKATGITVGTYPYTSQEGKTITGSPLYQGVWLADIPDWDAPYAQWGENDSFAGSLYVSVVDHQNSGPVISVKSSSQRSVTVPEGLSLSDPEVVDCMRSAITQQAAELIGSATFDAPALPQLDVPEITAKCSLT